jgi:hypothetical protein
MRPHTRIHPTVTVLESRELMSSVPVHGNPAGVPTEHGNGKGSTATTSSSIGTSDRITTLNNIVNNLDVGTTIYVSSGTGIVKPFGRVSIGGGSLTIVQNDPLGVSGSILLTNARGHYIGELKISGGQLPEFDFQVLKAKVVRNHFAGFSRVVGHGTGQLTFPQGEPSDNGPAVPFTITL